MPAIHTCDTVYTSNSWKSGVEIVPAPINVDSDAIDNNFDSSFCHCKSKSLRIGDVICAGLSCINYATQVECVDCDSDKCQNQRFQKRLYANLDVKEASGKGHGLYADEDLKAGFFVMEYVGEIISTKELMSRLNSSSKDNNSHLYIMSLKPGTFLDSRKKGNIGRFINHSCEPNCTIEIWNVRGKLKPGIFTLKDISKGEELSFDYKWKPSNNRPLSKCYCGTKSCRGYLEVVTEQDIENNELLFRKGSWVKGSSILKDVADNHESLIGKRVKLWWEGNQTYFEADVKGTLQKNGKNLHTLVYINDGQQTDEDLFDEKLDWYLLSETIESVSITRKSLQHDEIIETNIFSNIGNVHSIDSILCVDNKVDYKKKVKVSLTLDNANYIVVSSGYSDFSTTDVNNNAAAVTWERLQHLLQAKFEVSVSPPAVEMNLASSEQFLFLTGDRKSLNQVIDLIEDAKDVVPASKTINGSGSSLKRLQGICILNDWRVVYPLKNADASKIIKDINDDVFGIVASSDLPIVSFESSSSAKTFEQYSLISMLPESTTRQILCHMTGLVKRSHVPLESGAYAINILIRVLRTTGDNVVVDMVSLLAASVWVGLKVMGSSGNFELKRIVKSAYCQCFSREESDIGSSSHSFIEKTLEKEKEILSLLRFDIYIVPPTFYFFATKKHLVLTKVELDEYKKMVSIQVEFLLVVAANCPNIFFSLPHDIANASVYLIGCVLSFLLQGRSTDLTLTPNHVSHTFDAVFAASVQLLRIKRSHLDASVRLLVLQYLKTIKLDDWAKLLIPIPPSQSEWEVILNESLDVYLSSSGSLSLPSASNNDALNSKFFRLRLPWTCQHSNVTLQKSDSASFVSISDDLKNTNIDENTLIVSNAAQTVSFLLQESDVESSKNIRISLKKWPSKKQFKANKSGKFGYSADALKEMEILLHIHYLYSKGDFIATNILCPIGVFENHTFDMKRIQQDAYFLAIRPMLNSLNSIVSVASNADIFDRVSSIYPTIAAFFCIDLINALYHCFCCGIVFKWISIDDLYVSLNGSIMLCGFSGAEHIGVYASEESLNNKRSGGSEKRKSSKDADTLNTSNTSNEAESKDEIISLFPNSAPPEIILGDAPSEFSTIWSLSAICGHIFTGKAVIKTSSSLPKHVQYLYRVLGTPKLQGYDMKEFNNLPGAQVYGSYIINDDGGKSESRSRVLRNLGQCPIFQLNQMTSTDLNNGNDNNAINSADSKSCGSVLETITAGLHLVPSKRIRFDDLISSPAFKKIGGKYSNTDSDSDSEKREMVLKLLPFVNKK